MTAQKFRWHAVRRSKILESPAPPWGSPVSGSLRWPPKVAGNGFRAIHEPRPSMSRWLASRLRRGLEDHWGFAYPGDREACAGCDNPPEASRPASCPPPHQSTGVSETPVADRPPTSSRVGGFSEIGFSKNPIFGRPARGRWLPSTGVSNTPVAWSTSRR